MPVIAINGVDLHYDDAGAGAQVVLFLAGPWFDRRLFDRQLAALAGYRRLALDHRGLGRSSAPSARTIAVDTLVSDAVTLIEALGLPPVHLVGHDLGAEVALRIAARRPDRVRSALLMAVRPASNGRRLRVLAGVIHRLGPRAVAPLLPARVFGAGFRADPARADDRRLWSRRFATLSAGVAPILRGMADPGPSPAISCPALVLTGDAQPQPALDAASRMHEALPDSRLVRIPLAAGAMPVEQPEAVDAALRAFLARSAVAPRARDDHARGADLVI